MTQTQVLQKTVELLEKEEKFVVLPLEEYEDLLLSADPQFRQALKESKADLKAGRVKLLEQVVKEIKLEHENSSHCHNRPSLPPPPARKVA